MSSREWEFWVAFATLEPFGPLRDDLRAGEQVAATYGARGVQLAPADVFPTLRPPPRAGRERPGGSALRDALAALCPALTPTPVH